MLLFILGIIYLNTLCSEIYVLNGRENYKFIGEPLLCNEDIKFNFYLDENFTHIDGNDFTIPDKCNLKPKFYTLYYDKEEHSYQLAYGTFRYMNFKLNNLTFFYFKEFNFYNWIGLGYYFSNKHFSLIYQAYIEKLIPSPKFGLRYFNGENNSLILYLGGLTKNETENKLFGYCDVTSTNKTWGCILNKAEFNGNEYISNEFLGFLNLGKEEIYASKRFLSELKEKEAKMMDECYDIDANLNYFCSCENFKNFRDMRIYMSNYIYTFKKEEIIKRNKSDCKLLINGEHQNFKDSWALSSLIFKKFTVLFDYDEKKISFYGDNNIEYISILYKNNNMIKKIIYNITILQLLFSIGINIFIKIR